MIGGIPFGALISRTPGNVLWTPGNDSAVVAWFDPTQGIVLGTGSSVASWTDRIGGIAASQATSANQPTTSARNGKPRLAFNGSQSLSLPTTALPRGTTPSSIILAGYSAVSNPSTETFALGYGDASNATRYIEQYTSGIIDGGTAGSGNNINSAYSWNASDRLVIFELTGSYSGAISVDGNTTQAGSLANPFNTNAGLGAIGKWPAYGNSWNGDIAHIIIRTGGLTQSLRDKYAGWESRIDGKAGANLPAGHPYKSRAPYVSDP